MKLFVISDIHGSLSSFEAAENAFAKECADLMVICGDYLNHGPRNDIPAGYDTRKLAARLNEYKNRIVGVRGNCDSEVDQMMLDFPMQDTYTRIFLPSLMRVFVHHGHLFQPDSAAKMNPAGSIIVSGHTHIPLLEQKNGYTFVNPGSISIPKNGSLAGYALIESDLRSSDFAVSISLKTFSGNVISVLSAPSDC